MATTRLFFTTSVEEQWNSLAGPWLREQASAAWKNPKPTVVLTPSRAESFYLRSRLVEEGVSFLGLRFWTPSDARKFLLGKISGETRAATQAELRLVARLCAEKLLYKVETPDAILGSVVREPGPFLRAYDLLLGAGWDPAREGAVYGRALAREMGRALEEFHLASQAGLHRRLRHEALQSQPLIASLLVVGFNAAHWPLWDLLGAMVSCAEEGVVASSAPRVFGGEIDQLWVSSWEEQVGGVFEVPGPEKQSIQNNEDTQDAEGPFAGLVDSYERGEPGDAVGVDLTFLVTPELTSQARAVVLQTLDYLRRDSCARLGIVFPEANALAFSVAEELRRLGIPLDDGTGSIRPGLFEGRCWQSWMALQEEASVQRLVSWLRACEARGISCGLGQLSAREVANVLENALGESLVDDLNFLALHLEENSTARLAPAVADFLRRRIVLPETASFAEFLAMTRQALVLPGWEEHLAQLPIDSSGWLRKINRKLSRRIFLEWLKESTDSRERTRGAEGNHFYGKVHLLIYAQMTGQTWSHLILTGLNEGVWPRVFETGAFGSRHEWIALNQQARSLNRVSTGQGAQGMGHETVRAHHSHCLLPLERQDLALRDLCAALESTGEAVCLTAMTTEAGRSLLPSDFFNHAYHANTGGVLDEAAFRGLANVTSEWCRRHESLFQPEISFPDIAATRIAYEARRDATQPFGPYEFAFREPPVQPIQLPCKTWETVWNHPSAVWLEEIVGAAPWPEGTLSWPRAIGTWVHRWLATVLRECREKNSTKDFLSLLRKAADQEASRVGNRASATGLELYPWWDHVCGQARSMALGLGETLAPHLQEKQFLSEFRLPENLMIALPGIQQSDFLLKGRMDLLLVESGKAPSDLVRGDFSGCACWVIDFKTGSAQSLNAKRIGQGIGLQAVLYALAAQKTGAVSTMISLHTFDVPLEPQVSLDDVMKITPLFRSLDKFHRAGIFGMRDDAENEYGYAPAHPMATRFVPGNILRTKWELVHGAESVETEDES